jgi:sulfate adenylyltransferase subunit 1
MDLLRFITAGSVDDGKSTLIGRLLYDSKSILQDHLEVLESQSRSREEGEIDLALLTDGLRAEREQGITIDVAYKYFSTPHRKFIIADAPGHIQYTRNMITGASNADLMVVLIDARNGVIEQTRRHSIIASLLRISHVVVAINKMDLVDFGEDVFNRIREDYQSLARALHLTEVSYIPMAALKGDNVVERSARMPWYCGPSLLELLDRVEVKNTTASEPTRFPVQYVIRPQTDVLHDYRGYAGLLLSGNLRSGESVTILPAGHKATVRSISKGLQAVEAATAGQSIALELEEDVDISRGDVLVADAMQPVVSNEVKAIVCWMDAKPLRTGTKLLLQHHSRTVRCAVRQIEYTINVNDLSRQEMPDELPLNGLAMIHIRTQSPLVYDSFEQSRSFGGAILIDETSNITVGALLLQSGEV